MEKHLDTTLTAQARAEALVSLMILEERALVLNYRSHEIARLIIPEYNWWNEGLHGVSRAGTATMFPQAIGLAAMFDKDMMETVGKVIGLEARAKYNSYASQGDRDIYKGLTLWSPNINMFLDPRWGRGHETYGEDPYLTAELATRFVKGIQGDGKVMQAAACAKHYAVHSGPEGCRHTFDAIASPKEMEAYYLPHFKALVEAGCHICAGYVYEHVMEAHKQGLLSEAAITKAAIASMRTRIRLGQFDKDCELDNLSLEVVSCQEHKQVSLEAAHKSMVLLQNNGILPLDASKYYTIGVIGPNANSREALQANYFGTADRYHTFLEGIQDAFDGRVLYSLGAHLYKDSTTSLGLYKNDRIAEAVAVAQASDVVILCVGLDADLEGEEGDAGNQFAAGDKVNIKLPDSQRLLVEKVLEVGKPTVVVIASGSALNVEADHADAIIQAWYPGSEGGTALADILFGKVSPSWKLPITFYESCDALPDLIIH